MGSKPDSTTGMIFLATGVLSVIICIIAYSMVGERFWNYGPNDPFTPFLHVLYMGLWVAPVLLIGFGIKMIRASRPKK